MKRLLTIGLMSLILASFYSFVYACDHTNKGIDSAMASKTLHMATTSNTKTIRTLVVGATSGCSTVESVVSFDIDVPGRTSPQFIHIEATDKGTPTSSVVRTAMTLGRAFVTTVGAVWGSLLDAATERTAFLV